MSQIIKTERLILRPIRMADAPAVVDGVSDIETSRWLTHVPHPYGLADARDFISANETTFPKVVAIEIDGALVGVSGIGKELGYWLNKSVWGKGIALEAAEALLAHYFATTDADAVRSGYVLGNNRSRKILEILGFSNVEIKRATPLSTGVEIDVQKMSLSRARWEAMR